MVTIFMILYLLLWGVFAAGGIAGYVLRGVGMYTLGKRRGLENIWMAFVPFLRTYFQGELCGTLKFGKRELKNPGLWLLLIPIAVQIVSGLFIAVFVAAAVVGVMGVTQDVLSGLPSELPDFGNEFGHRYGYEYDYSYVYPYPERSDNLGAIAGLGVALLLLFLVFLVVMTAATAAQYVLTALINRQIFAAYVDGNYALAHAVAGIFIPLYTSVYFFLIRNRRMMCSGDFGSPEAGDSEPENTGTMAPVDAGPSEQQSGVEA